MFVIYITITMYVFLSILLAVVYHNYRRYMKVGLCVHVLTVCAYMRVGLCVACTDCVCLHEGRFVCCMY